MDSGESINLHTTHQNDAMAQSAQLLILKSPHPSINQSCMQRSAQRERHTEPDPCFCEAAARRVSCFVGCRNTMQGSCLRALWGSMSEGDRKKGLKDGGCIGVRSRLIVSVCYCYRSLLLKEGNKEGKRDVVSIACLGRRTLEFFTCECGD
jgi:hypothetical protein